MDASQMAGKVLDRREDYSDRRQLRQDITEWAMDTSSGEPGCLLIGGPGAGKSRPATRLAASLTSKGVRVHVAPDGRQVLRGGRGGRLGGSRARRVAAQRAAAQAGRVDHRSLRRQQHQ